MSKLEQMVKDIPMLGRGAAEVIASTYGKHVQLNGGRNEVENALLQATRRLFEDIAQRGGVDPASFLNMNPWPIVSTGPLLDGIIIPECPIGQPYVQYVHRDIRVDRAETPGGVFIPSAVWPIVLMRDVLRQHDHLWGGQVVYMGDVRLGDSRRKAVNTKALLETVLRKTKDEETKLLIEQLASQQAAPDDRYASTADVEKMIIDAKAKQIHLYRKRCERVGTTHESDAKTAFRSITPNDRLMARWLHNEGIYPVLPKWVTQERPDDYKPKACSKCGADVDLKGFGCPKCNYIYDGIKAFQAGEVDKSHVSLKRHTREELDAAGLGDILTLEEERSTEPKKDKPEPKGRPA